MNLRPYQQEAVDAVYNYLREHEDNPCVVLPTGCHAKGHPILMFDGSVKAVENIKVGDVIMGADSTPRHVLALARGREQMVKIVPNKGESFIVNVNHILSLVSTNEGKSKYQCYQKGGELTNITVADYLQKSKTWKHLRKLYHVAIDFPEQQNELEIPPYILGILLGDGNIINGVGVTTMDIEIAEEFINYAESLGCYVRISNNGSQAATYCVAAWKKNKNPFIEKLRHLEIWGHKFDTKFIPKHYLTADKKSRMELLAGLIDSDGYTDNCGGCVDYVTASKQLSDDIAFLGRSLGLCVTQNIKHAKCQTGKEGVYYRLCISGNLTKFPFRRFKHQISFIERKMKKNPLRTGFKVELLPEDDFFGFALDGDHLYVDGNFLVHHNTGKSVVIGRIASDAVLQWNGRVLILAHVKELLEQNAAKIVSLCPEIPVGIFSAGLKSRDTDEPIIVAGIQSVYNKACDLGSFDLILVDEAHLIAPDGEGMYRTFLNDMKVINPNVRVIGLTATPYRLKGGLICKPENMLNAVCYDAGLKEMILQGYLSPLVSRAGKAEAKLSNLHVRGGEFLNVEVTAAMDKKEITDFACEEIVELTKDRKSVLIFCTSVEHCQHVMDRLRYLGQVCEMVTGDTPAAERAELLERFKGKEIPIDLFGNMKPPLKYLVNMNVLTTGFDAPNVDCVVLLRPTASAGLLVQMVGRGLRLSPQTGKKDCLILDYGENILRHGPIDCISVKDKTSGKGGNAPAKKCPECLALIHAGYGKCPECGYEFPIGEGSNLQGKASTAAILSGQVSYTEYNVGAVHYSIHAKKGMADDVPKTMRVDYEIGFHQFKSEWVCPEHSGYARNKFVKWWKERCALGCPVPMTTGEAVDMAQNGLLAPVTAIKVKSVSGEKFDRIAAWTFGERPILPDFYKTETEGTEDSDIWSVEMDDDNIPF